MSERLLTILKLKTVEGRLPAQLLSYLLFFNTQVIQFLPHLTSPMFYSRYYVFNNVQRASKYTKKCNFGRQQLVKIGECNRPVV